MKRKSLSIAFFLICACSMSEKCLADTKPTESCDFVKKSDNSQISEEASQKKELLPLGEIISSNLEIPGNTIKFVTEIPYDEILWSTLKVSAEIIEYIADDGFFLGFLIGYYCNN